MLWLAIICLGASQAQGTASPYTQELKALVTTDQADRQFKSQPSKEEMARMLKNDVARLARTREILIEAKWLSADDFDAASLLFQHGARSEDTLVAHELAACAGALGKIGSLPALTEDRLLMRLGRLQRFGSQYSWTTAALAVKLNPVDEKLPTAVTDDLRTDYFVPSLALSRKFGIGANEKAMDAVFARVKIRRNPKHRPAERLAPGAITPATVLGLYRSGRLQTDRDLRNAAAVLTRSKDPERLILAHELATLALIEGDRKAGRLFEKTWDRFAVAIGQKPRYSAGLECAAVRRVLETER